MGYHRGGDLRRESWVAVSGFDKLQDGTQVTVEQEHGPTAKTTGPHCESVRAFILRGSTVLLMVAIVVVGAAAFFSFHFGVT